VEEQQLIRLLKKNDRNAYRFLFDKYFERLFLFAVHIVFREDVANDIVQEIFIRLYEKSGDLNFESSLKSYLFNSVRNRCFNYLRDRKVEDRRMNLYAEACIWSDNIELVKEEDVMARIHDLLNILPDKCRDICRRRWVDGQPIEDIARKLDMSESTVRVQIHRGMEKLRKHLDDDDWAVILFFLVFPGMLTETTGKGNLYNSYFQ